MRPRQPFTSGPRLADAPSGDPATQATASLGGYAYQLYASGLAWLDLRPGQELYLEIAQDYAVATRDALRAVQVKHTSANVTINAEHIRNALDSFVDLVERNPEREVQLHFLSTCSVGQEQKREHRANGEPSLAYWRRAAAGADVQPLREVFGKINLSDRVRRFIEVRGDAALREEFLRRIQWDCGAQSLEGVQRELENGLLRYHVDRFHAPARREQLAAAVLRHVLTTAVNGGQQRLTDSDLLALVTDTARVLVSPAEFEAAMRGIGAAFAGRQDASNLEAVDISRLLETERELPLPPLLAERNDLTRDLSERTRRNGTTFVSGSTGCGKTTVARLTARADETLWRILDLRENSADQIVQRLDVAIGALGTAGCRGMILDDLNEIEDPVVRRAVARFLAALRRRDMLCLITAYRQPSNRALSELGLDESAHLAVPDLSKAEIAALVLRAGGDGEKWSAAVQRASAWGHPQLVQAIISGLRTRGWPEAERQSLLSFSPSADLELERRAARSRIFSMLPEETTVLLYRISLLFDRFDRQLALSVGAIDPAVAEPGAHLDQLIGPWVELAVRGDMRVSPLLQNAGSEILSPAEAKRVHETAAQYILGGSVVNIDKANIGFMHALLSDQEWLLTRLAYNIITASEEIRRQLSEWMASLRLHRFDRKIYAKGRAGVPILLRLAQFLLIASAGGKPNTIRNCWDTLQAEIVAIEDAETLEHFEYMILAKALISEEAVAFLPDPVGLMLRFEVLSQRDPVRRAMLQERTSSADGRTHTVLGTIFISYALRIRSVPDLQRAFDTLDAATPALRAALLSDVSDMPDDATYVVSHAWLEESRRETTDWRAHLEAYRRMAGQANNWGYRDLALRCHIARGIILDEYLKDPTAGLAALDEAEAILGNASALDRARAKIYFRRKDHEAALRLVRESAGKADRQDAPSHTYMLREAAISAAELGQWAEACEWFAAARASAATAWSPGIKLMAVGLRADEALAAYKAADVAAALSGLGAALDELESIDPAGLNAAEYLHRAVRHSILWVFGQATATPVEVGGEPTVMMPGMCSNPEPPDVSDLPLGPSDYAWYFLVQAEIASGVSAGIEAGLRAHLAGRVIPNMEMLVRGTRMEFLLRQLDVRNYIAALPAWVDSQIYLDLNRDALMRHDSENPIYGEIPPATSEQLKSDRAEFSADDALLSFGIFAALRGRTDALNALCASGADIQSGYGGQNVLKLMDSGGSGKEEFLSYVAREIHRVARNPDLSPDELFVACARFSQWAKKSNLQRVLAPAIKGWARTRWKRAIEEQTFNMRNPASSVPPIRAALAASDDGLKFVGRLMVAAEPAVHHKFDHTFRQYLLSL